MLELKEVKQGSIINYTLNKYGRSHDFMFVVKSINKTIIRATSYDLMPITMNIPRLAARIRVKEITNFKVINN